MWSSLCCQIYVASNIFKMKQWQISLYWNCAGSIVKSLRLWLCSLVFILSEAAGYVNIRLKYQVEGIGYHLRDDLQTNKHCAVDPLTRDKNKATYNVFLKQYIRIYLMHAPLHTTFDIVPSTLTLNGKIYKFASLGIIKPVYVAD